MQKRLNEVKARYLNLFPDDLEPKTDISLIENELGLHLPEDFKIISEFYSGGYVGNYSIFSFYKENDDYNIIDRTLYYRQIDLKLPINYISFAETEVSFIFMKIVNEKKINGEVYITSIHDIYNLSNGKQLEYDYDYFPSFTDFFEYLIKQEEESQKEEA